MKEGNIKFLLLRKEFVQINQKDAKKIFLKCKSELNLSTINAYIDSTNHNICL